MTKTGYLRMADIGTRRPAKARLPAVREHPLHKQIADAFRFAIAPPGRISGDGVVWWSVDAASFAGVAGARQGRGIVAGVPDIAVAWAGLLFMIEVKADDGLMSEAQRNFVTALAMAGCRWGIARDADEALALLRTWGVPVRNLHKRAG